MDRVVHAGPGTGPFTQFLMMLVVQINGIKLSNGSDEAKFLVNLLAAMTLNVVWMGCFWLALKRYSAERSSPNLVFTLLCFAMTCVTVYETCTVQHPPNLLGMELTVQLLQLVSGCFVWMYCLGVIQNRLDRLQAGVGTVWRLWVRSPERIDVESAADGTVAKPEDNTSKPASEPNLEAQMSMRKRQGTSGD